MNMDGQDASVTLLRNSKPVTTLAGKLFVGSEFTSASARVAPYAVNPLAVGGGRRLKGGMENAH